MLFSKQTRMASLRVDGTAQEVDAHADARIAAGARRVVMTYLDEP